MSSYKSRKNTLEKLENLSDPKTLESTYNNYTDPISSLSSQYMNTSTHTSNKSADYGMVLHSTTSNQYMNYDPAYMKLPSPSGNMSSTTIANEQGFLENDPDLQQQQQQTEEMGNQSKNNNSMSIILISVIIFLLVIYILSFYKRV